MVHALVSIPEYKLELLRVLSTTEQGSEVASVIAEEAMSMTRESLKKRWVLKISNIIDPKDVEIVDNQYEAGKLELVFLQKIKKRMPLWFNL